MGYYNVGRRSFMSGIDRGDQLMGYYNVGRWYFCIPSRSLYFECVHFAKDQYHVWEGTGLSECS